jgi:uncharacterized membrane protein YeaQ/YmgE (transglycosylase-associated protein family)
VLFLILSTVIGGLILGALGRLVVPGRQPLGCLGTALVGIGGAFLGGAASRVLWARPQDHVVLTFVLEVLGAALIVYLVKGRRRGRV